jgi:Uma2 family endonuclease
LVSLKIEFSGDKPDTLLSPLVVIEILSNSFESIDRGIKSTHYRQIPSLREYIPVSQNSPKIEKSMLQKYLKKDYFDEKMILLDFIAKILKVMLMI